MSFTLADIIRRHAADTPNAPALTFEGVTWSFEQLHALSSQSANALHVEGVRAGDRVALLTRNRAEFYELIFACSKIGAILVGLNWRLAPPEIAAIMADARPTVLIVGSTEQSMLNEASRQLPGLRRIIGLGEEYDAWRAAGPASDPGHAGQPDDVTLLLYTSGTTGLPKGVMLTNSGMSFTLRLGAESWGMGRDSVNLVAMPMFHIGGSGYGMSTMAVGGHTVLMREVNTAQAIANIERYRVTHTFFVPAVVQALLETPGVEQADLSSMQLLMYGASPIGDVLLNRALKVLRCRFMQAYGMTETSGTIVVLVPEDHDPGGERAGLLRSCGRAMPWVELRIIDPTTLGDAPTGSVGEIWVRSGMVMRGYWNKPDATAQTILPGGWLRTGDAAYQDAEGYVYLFDRFKDMIISGGENIYPAEVENALSGHPAIQEVAVIGVPHARWGETPKAVVVLRPGHEVQAQALIDYVRERLAHYKCPTVLVFADSLPRNASGKLLKRELRISHGQA
ncbi:MAG: long-chain-fatty-acid--CoA ligase [Betaproteobacteria bacterium]|nr:long-chain-fatty-acid--CoA ligase [Betaproteobacteria bacterium]